MTELTRFPRVRLQEGPPAYGGSQQWYRNPWRRLSGCAAVSATNLAAYYGIGMAPDEPSCYTLAAYRRKMNQMFREYMTSGRMGFPDPDRYADAFAEYAARYGVLAVPEKLYQPASVKEAADFTGRRLAAEEPAVLLILKHTAKELDDITWHWMTVTGLCTDRDELVVSNYGKREIWPASLVFAPLAGNQTYLIAFDLTPA